MFLRRLLLLSLVLASLAQGCATPAVQCGIGAVEPTQQRLPATGRVVVDWIYEQDMPFNRFGEAFPLNGQLVIRMKGEPPRWDDTCGLAKLGHEVLHYYRSHQ